MVTHFFDRFHLLIRVMRLREATPGAHLCQGPVGAAPAVTDTLFFQGFRTLHALARALRPQGPGSCYPEGRFSHLGGSAASPVSQHVPSPPGIAQEKGEVDTGGVLLRPHRAVKACVGRAGLYGRCLGADVSTRGSCVLPLIKAFSLQPSVHCALSSCVRALWGRSCPPLLRAAMTVGLSSFKGLPGLSFPAVTFKPCQLYFLFYFF